MTERFPFGVEVGSLGRLAGSSCDAALCLMRDEYLVGVRSWEGPCKGVGGVCGVEVI